jgi:hypothetical protein
MTDERETPIQRGVKNDDGKNRLDLIRPWTLLRVGEVLTYGAKKYGVDNWLHVTDGQARFYAAALRHLLAWKGGEKLDKDSGLSHLAHAITNIMFLLEKEANG